VHFIIVQKKNQRPEELRDKVKFILLASGEIKLELGVQFHWRFCFVLSLTTPFFVMSLQSEVDRDETMSKNHRLSAHSGDWS
jgi:hypothetical protein